MWVDFIHFIFLVLSHLKHISQKSRKPISEAVEIKDFSRTALSNSFIQINRSAKISICFWKTARGYPIIQKVSCLETESSPVVLKLAACWNQLQWEWIPPPSSVHTPCAPPARPLRTTSPGSPWVSWVSRGVPRGTHRELWPYFPLLFLLSTHHPTDIF